MSELRGGLLYFDCHAGVAGDMVVGALVDLGVPRSVIDDALAALPLHGYRIGFERVMRGALEGLKFSVLIDPPAPSLPPSVKVPTLPRPAHAHPGIGAHSHAHHGAHAHRHYADIRAMIRDAKLSEGTRARALDLFDRIAKVEARLHGVSVDEVAFHEVGAIDSIVDLVAAAAALDWLAPARVVSRRVPLGSGSVATAHGLLPIPAPATLELLAGVPVEDGGVAGELTTPTGAAILAGSCSSFGPLPPCTVAAVGWGAGDRELPDRPNLLRVIAGRPSTDGELREEMIVLEANLDDLTPELAAPLIDALLAAGARDAWMHPLLMKKGRPGLLVGALAAPDMRAAIEAVLFRESSTIGVRAHGVARTVLAREQVEVETPFGRIAMKVARRGDDVLNAAPEFEACRAAAAAHGVPLKRVHAEAIAAYYRR